MNNLPDRPQQQQPQSMIERAALDPGFNLEKFERLVSHQREAEQRAADLRFNEAFAAASAEMRSIATDASNPQTRSRYATFAKVYNVLHPIYSQHGFGVGYSTEPIAGDPNTILVVGYLTCGSITRRYQIPVPIDTKGPQGKDVMTRTHAVMSAYSYGQRRLLLGMFGIAVGGEDDDGNVAGGRRPPPPAGNVKPQPQQRAKVDLVNPSTGELISGPIAIEMWNAGDLRAWGELFIDAVKTTSVSQQDVTRWMAENSDTIGTMERTKPVMHASLCKAIGEIIDGLPA